VDALRVAVLGPGGVGGLVGTLLARQGHAVTCLAGAETAGHIERHGLRLVSDRYGEVTAPAHGAELLTEPVDVCLVTPKATRLEEALERVPPTTLGDAVVVPLLNGLEHMDVLRGRFDGRVAAGSISHFQAYRAGRVQVVEATASPLITIASETLPRAEVERAADILRRGRVDVRVGQNERRVLWHKLARIAPLAAATSASGRTVGELRDDGVWRSRLDSAIAETCAVADADGVQLQPAAQWAIIDEMADDTTTSAARDVVAGRRSELDAIVGSVLRLAERYQVPCPTLTELAGAAGLR
jgi:2-dehydropantoate 2-reductase